MERKAHLLFCEKCTNRKFDQQKGLVCKLTNEQADFDPYCPEFNEDTVEAEKLLKYKHSYREHDGTVGKGKRFANFIIDRIASLLLTMMIGVVIAFVNPSLLDHIDDLTDTAITLLVYVLYYIVMEFTLQTTIGKLITGTVVVDLDGNKPSLTAIVGRSFSRIVPFEAFSFLGSEASGWHDTWSKTKVVKKSFLKNNFSDDSDILDQEFLKE